MSQSLMTFTESAIPVGLCTNCGHAMEGAEIVESARTIVHTRRENSNVQLGYEARLPRRNKALR